MVFLYFFVPGLQPEAVAFLRGHLSPLAFLVARLAYLTTMLILLVLAYFWPKQYDFAAFEYEPGNPAFHLMKLGKGSAEYASFLDLLLKQIAASRKQESTPASCE